MNIQRDSYLNQLIAYRFDGLIKVITGIRRCGKSYLLKKLYRDYLLQNGVNEDQIISIELDLNKDIKYRNPLLLSEEVRKIVLNSDQEYYLFIDEIQMSDIVLNPYNPEGKKITFYDALNDLRSISNLDVYVTGSNSKMLSTDILTEFRGRSDEIRVHPLSFQEYYSAVGGDRQQAFEEYALYGGMPLILSRPSETAKMNYLKSLFSEVYIKDIIERKKIEHPEVLGLIIDLLCSSVGSLTNPTRIDEYLKTNRMTTVSPVTIRTYIEYLEEISLFTKRRRYDVRKKKHLDYPCKYYSEDIGLRNARIGFRQQEMTHIMENIIFNELISRQFSVDIGVVYAREINDNGSSVKTPREIDFVVDSGGKKTYIQSAYAMVDESKLERELRPFDLVKDSFPKIVVRLDVGKRWYDDKGVLHINLIDFLLDKNLI